MNKALIGLNNSKPRIEGYEKAIKSIKDPEMRDFVDSLWVLTAKRGLYYLRAKRNAANLEFSRLVKDATFDSITWDFVCEIVGKQAEMGYYCCFLMCKLLDEGRFSGDYSEKLYELKEIFRIPERGVQDRYYPTKFCGDDIKYMFKLKEAFTRRYFLIKTDNPNLWNIMAEFCERDKNSYSSGTSPTTRDWFFANIHRLFDEDEASLNKIADFSYATFKHEISKCLEAPRAVELLRMLQRFYVFLIEHPSGEGADIFLAHDDMDITVLKRDDFAKRIIDGFSYIYYNPLAPVPETDKWILHINGHDRAATKLNANTTKTFDFTRIQSPLYRKLAKRYFWNMHSGNFNTKYEHFVAIIPMLNKLSELKKKERQSRIYSRNR